MQHAATSVVEVAEGRSIHGEKYPAPRIVCGWVERGEIGG
jgi:hypothetical protein